MERTLTQLPSLMAHRRGTHRNFSSPHYRAHARRKKTAQWIIISRAVHNNVIRLPLKHGSSQYSGEDEA